jgi:hypothetical protein
VLPLVENPGAVLTPKAQVFVVDETRRVIAGPLVITRRRAYHREWLLGFVGVGGRAVVEAWRDQFLAIEAPDAGD